MQKINQLRKLLAFSEENGNIYQMMQYSDAYPFCELLQLCDNCSYFAMLTVVIIKILIYLKAKPLTLKCPLCKPLEFSE